MTKSLKKQIVIVSGLSGAGKTHALKILEDFNFFCIDNLPLTLLEPFIEITKKSHNKFKQIALGIDVREGETISRLPIFIEEINKKGLTTKLIFLEADINTLLHRFSETRRKHPLGESVLEGIKKEIKLLQPIKSIADKIVDTTDMTISQLKSIFSDIIKVQIKKKLFINIISFGYKFGIPPDADLVFDVRFLPNPNYIANLKPYNGLSQSVKKFVLKNKTTQNFIKRFFSLIKNLIPHYIKEGKSYLTIAIGCTGGRHRSVVIAERLYEFLKKNGYLVNEFHRDINEK